MTGYIPEKTQPTGHLNSYIIFTEKGSALALERKRKVLWIE